MMKLNYFGRLAAMAAAVCFTSNALDATAPRAGIAWNLDVAEGGCMLTGNIAGDDPVSIALQTVPGTDTYTLMLTGKKLPRLRDEDNWSPVTLSFGGVEQGVEGRLHVERLKSGQGDALMFENLKPDMIAAFARASSLSFAGEAKAGPFPLSGTKAAAGALTSCVHDQLVEWGADPLQFAAGGKAPVALTPREDWVSRDVISRLAQTVDRSDFGAYFRLSIASDGSVDECVPISEVSDKGRKIVCDAILKQRLFTPASDAAGKPVRGVAAFRLGVIRRSRITHSTPTR